MLNNLKTKILLKITKRNTKISKFYKIDGKYIYGEKRKIKIDKNDESKIVVEIHYRIRNDLNIKFKVFDVDNNELMYFDNKNGNTYKKLRNKFNMSYYDNGLNDILKFNLPISKSGFYIFKIRLSSSNKENLKDGLAIKIYDKFSKKVYSEY